MLFLVLCRRQVVECFVEAFVVVEADEVEDLVLEVLEAGEAAAVDELVLRSSN